MSEENVEIVRTMYESWERGDLSAGAADLDPHVTFVVPPSFLESGVYHGPEGVRDYMRCILAVREQ